MAKKLSLYFHTLRHLRPVQITSRIQAKLHSPGPDLRPAPSVREKTGVWVLPPEREPVMTGPNTFFFLNETHIVEKPEDWDFASPQKVSRFNLHYFDDLNAKEAAARREWHHAIIERWAAEHLPGQMPGWDPYPTSLRIVNWIKWNLAGNPFSEAALHSLAVQVRYLSGHLERKLLGNHLLANAKALVFAGFFFRGKEADGWLETGLKILKAELPEQILKDGGHFERSTMYQGIMLEDMLDLINLTRAYPDTLASQWKSMPSSWQDDIQRMRFWLKTMCHPNGEIAFFNDAALGIAPTSMELEAYSARLHLPGIPELQEGITHLAESGYVRLQHGPAVALLDVARVGPDYVPAHAHADTLSFELSLFGERFLVNTGTSTYAINPQRTWERSTASHNTVALNDRNSSETWASFRVAQRAYPFDLVLRQEGKGSFVQCAHDGYSRLPGKPVHKRLWMMDETSMQITDLVEGAAAHAVAYFYLHPQVILTQPPMPQAGTTETQAATLSVTEHPVTFTTQEAPFTIKPSFYAPEFGRTVPNVSLSAPFDTQKLTTKIRW